jgi:hypothetical protein
MSASSSRSVAAGAFVASGAALLGAIAVVLWLLRGLPLGGGNAAERAEYVVRHHRCWSWGWLLAGLGAILVVNLYRILAARWEAGGGWCRFAMLLATAGLAVDLAGISLWIVVSPGQQGDSFLLVERLASALSLFAAKILYAGAGVMLTIAGRRELPGWLAGLAWVVWLSGLAVATFTLCACERQQFYSLGILAVSFIAWAALLGFHFLGQRAAADSSRPFAPDPRD